MKKLVLLLFLFSACVQAQHGNVARTLAKRLADATPFELAPLQRNAQPSDTRYQKAVSGATVATLTPSSMATLFATRPDVLRLSIPYGDENLSILMYKVEVTTSDFEVKTDKGALVTPEAGLFYRGILENHPESLAAFSFFRTGFSGIVSDPSIQNLNVVKLQIPGNTSDYIIYSDAKLNIPNSFQCHTSDKGAVPSTPSAQRGVTTERCVTLYFEIDYDLYLANNSNTDDTTNWMLALYNNVQTIYTNDEINTVIKSLYIWTEQDPYFGSASVDYLYQFHALRPVFNGDLGQLVGIDEGGLGGVAATINGLCSDQNFSYSDVFLEFETVPTFSWSVMVVTHEFGHLLGSPHTHACFWNGDGTMIDGCGPTANLGFSEGDCPIAAVPTDQVGGTIMSYCHLLSAGVNLANGFGPQPAAQIQQSMNNSTCLSTDCINTCISLVHDVKASTITDDAVTISWDDENSVGTYEVGLALYPFTDYTWTTVNNATTTTFSGLLANTYYKILIRPICGGLTSLARGTIFATNTDYCVGTLFLDSGGAGGFYTDMEDWVRVVKPADPGAKIKVTFAMIDIEYGYDFLYIHDGDSTNAPLLTPLGITGGDIEAGPFESTDATGALTFHFTSDQYISAEGWNAQITCTNLSTGQNDLIDFTYNPNPTNGRVFLHASRAFRSIRVYGIDGRRLLERTTNATDEQVDLSGFASGTYVFQVDLDGKPMSFRIVKQ